MKTHFLAALLSVVSTVAMAQDHLVFEPKANTGTGAGKHVVLIAGDEEYRSEEGLPMLAKILSQRHGFKCTVLFSLDDDGTINPDRQDRVSHSVALDSADAIVMLLRFRRWPEADMARFDAAVKRGVPVVGLRTSTHAFAGIGGDFGRYNQFGEKTLGEEWVSHWGGHKSEATRGVVEKANAEDPILKDVTDVFGDTDVYEAYPPADAKILLRGQVLKGMKPDSPAADYRKKRASDKQEQGVNDPMMAVAWSREVKNDAGGVNRIMCTTMGAATDLQSEGLRRLVVNSVFWGLKMDVPAKADVAYVDPFKPTDYGFKGYQKGTKPSDYALGSAGPKK